VCDENLDTDVHLIYGKGMTAIEHIHSLDRCEHDHPEDSEEVHWLCGMGPLFTNIATALAEDDEPSCSMCGATTHTEREITEDGEWSEDCVFVSAYREDGRAKTRRIG
jgi:hypothetical protein